MAFYFVRHGETQWNVERRLQGEHDIPLNENGRRQALALHEEIKKRQLDLRRVYVSPLKRALETAMLASGRSREECIIDERLREMAFGSLEGEKYYHPGDSAEVMNNMRAFLGKPTEFIPPAGEESFYEVLDRTADFLTDLREYGEEAGGDILVVTHGALLHGILFHLEGRTDVDGFWETSTPNCQLLAYHKIPEKIRKNWNRKGILYHSL